MAVNGLPAPAVPQLGLDKQPTCMSGVVRYEVVAPGRRIKYGDVGECGVQRCWKSIWRGGAEHALSMALSMVAASGVKPVDADVTEVAVCAGIVIRM